MQKYDQMIEPFRRISAVTASQSPRKADRPKRTADEVDRVNYKDTLTGLYNRSYIDEYLPVAMRLAYQREQPLSLIFVDIDQFQLVNDRHGQIAGDLVLQHVAQLLQKKIRRPESWVARYGGDEFVLCIPGLDNSAARRTANSIRVAIMGERFPLESGEVKLTCSFGVQTLEKSDFQFSALMLLHQAQEKLTLAKLAGRNTVV